MKNDLGPEVLKDEFHFKQYNLRNDSTLQRQKNRAVNFEHKAYLLLPPK